MPYDLISHAKKVKEAADRICQLEQKLGKHAFADAYRMGREQSKSSDSLLRALQDGDSNVAMGVRVFVTIEDYIESKQQLARNLLGRCTLTTTDRTAETVFHTIGLDEALAADRIVKPLLSQDPKLFEDFGMGNSYLEDADLENMSWDQFHGDHSVAGYVHGRILTRVLILPVTPSKALPRIINEIQMCYAFGQMTAIHGLCRALIETALTDVCLRVGKLTPEQVADNYFFKDFPPSKRITWTLPRGRDRSEAFALYTATSRVIHGSKAPEDTRSIVRRSIALVERLYSRHAHQLAKNRNA